MDPKNNRTIAEQIVDRLWATGLECHPSLGNVVRIQFVHTQSPKIGGGLGREPLVKLIEEQISESTEAKKNPPATKEHSPAIRDVIAERERQQGVEGYSVEQDTQYSNRELAQAAMGFVDHYVGYSWLYLGSEPLRYIDKPVPDNWPWDDEHWKPKTPRRDLVRAAALLLAEIERYDSTYPEEKQQS